MARPNLFIVGAPKCGTTAWQRYLETHPDIYFAELKEPSYFAFDLPGVRLTRSLEDYERLFRRGSRVSYRGEASALHLYSEVAAKEIARYNPDSKILIFLRDREGFLRSLHQQLLYRFAESIEDFAAVWRLSGNRPTATIPRECPEPKLLDYRSFASFGHQVERYLSAFPADRVRVIRFADWTADPRATYLEILGFLGLEDDGRIDFPQVNEAKAYRIRWLGRLVAHPPWIVEKTVALLRRLTGRSALRLGERTSNLLAARGYRTEISSELRDEIGRFYEQDERLLERLLDYAGKPPACRRRQSRRPM